VEAERIRVKSAAEHVLLSAEARGSMPKPRRQLRRAFAWKPKLSESKAERVRLEAEMELERLKGFPSIKPNEWKGLGQLAEGVAHDSNNLLAVILNYAAFVAKSCIEPLIHRRGPSGVDLS